MQVQKPLSVIEMENNVFGDLNGVYTKTLASARAAHGDGSAWDVSSKDHAANRAKNQVGACQPFVANDCLNFRALFRVRSGKSSRLLCMVLLGTLEPPSVLQQMNSSPRLPMTFL
jgi:hypothetical protein